MKLKIINIIIIFPEPHNCVVNLERGGYDNYDAK